MGDNELQNMMDDLDKKYEILQGDKDCKIKYILKIIIKYFF